MAGVKTTAINEKELNAVLAALDFRVQSPMSSSMSGTIWTFDLRCTGRSRWRSDSATRERGSVYPCVHGYRALFRYLVDQVGVNAEDIYLGDYNWPNKTGDMDLPRARNIVERKCSCTEALLRTHRVGIAEMLEDAYKRGGVQPTTQPDPAQAAAPLDMQDVGGGLMLPVIRDPVQEQYRRLMQKPPSAPDMEGTLVQAFRAYTLGPWPKLLVGSFYGEWKTKQLVAECWHGSSGRPTQSTQPAPPTTNGMSFLLYEDETLDPHTGQLLAGAVPKRPHLDNALQSDQQQMAERDLTIGLADEALAKKCQEHLLNSSCPGERSGGTGCGIYAYTNPMRAYNQVGADGTIVTLVTLKGLVMQYTDGYRASHAEITKIWMVKKDQDVGGTERYDNAMANLLSFYFGSEAEVVSKEEWETLVREELSKTPVPELFKAPPMRWPWET